MEIRCMTTEDYNDVYALWTNTAGMGLHGFEDSREGIGRFLARNPGCSFVAVEDNKVIGAALGGHDGRKGCLYHAAVDAAYRGRGAGRLLMDAVKRAFLGEGVTKLGLLVYKGNEAGNAFWRSTGWSEREDVNYYSLYMDNNG